MPVFDRGTFTVLPAAVLAMADPAKAEPEWRRIRALAGRRGSVLDAIGADLWGGLGAIWTGDLGLAVDLLERAMEARRCSGARATRTWPTPPPFSRSRGTSAGIASARGPRCITRARTGP